MPKKLLFYLSRNLTKNARGAELHTFMYISQYLSRIGFEIYYFGPNAALENVKSAHYIRYDCNISIPILRDIHSLIYFIIVCRNIKPDRVVALGGIGTNCLKVVTAGKILSIKSIIRSAGDTLNVHRFQKGFLKKLKFYFRQNLLARFSFLLCDYCIVVGQSLRQSLVNRRIITFDKSFVISGYLRRDEFYAMAKNASRQKLELPVQGQLVGYAGGLDFEKGLDHLVDLVRGLPADYKVVIAGEPTIDTTDPLIHELLESESVIFLGVLEAADLLYFYNSINVLVFLTKVGGGYGQVNLEASLCETPVLGLDVGLDVSWLLEENACSGVGEICNRIIKSEYQTININREIFKDENITKSWVDILSK